MADTPHVLNSMDVDPAEPDSDDGWAGGPEARYARFDAEDAALLKEWATDSVRDARHGARMSEIYDDSARSSANQANIHAAAADRSAGSARIAVETAELSADRSNTAATSADLSAEIANRAAQSANLGTPPRLHPDHVRTGAQYWLHARHPDLPVGGHDCPRCRAAGAVTHAVPRRYTDRPPPAQARILIQRRY